MKKTLIALAVLGLGTTAVYAQSNVTIYGVVDTGYYKESGRDVYMGENTNNRIGFRGAEDLGGGLKATFELEQRFNLNDGTAKSDREWEGAANIGLSGEWGRVRFGRVNELPTESFRQLDPFFQDGVAHMLYNSQRVVRISNTARYDSPNFNGLVVSLTYSLGENTKNVSNALTSAGADNDGYALSLHYDKGPLVLLANWSRLADSDNGYVWDIGAGYRFGPAKVTLGYERTKDKGWNLGKATRSWLNPAGVKSKQDNWMLGLEWQVGPGRVMGLVNYVKVDDSNVAALDDKDAFRYGLGYTWDLSKRTAFYFQAAYTDYDNKSLASFYRGSNKNALNENDSVYGISVGMTHKF